MSSMDSKPKNAASAVIRLATERDAEEIAAIYAPKKRVLTAPHP